MSWGQPPNQPPYGQPPGGYGQPQGQPQGWGQQQPAPFGSPGAHHGGYVPPPPPKKSKTGCIIGLVIGTLFLGTCVTGGVIAAKSFGSGIEVPEKKKDYVGSWVGKGVALRIQENGTVNYLKRSGNSNTSLSGIKISEFDGDDFVVGYSFMSTRFDVSSPPEKDGDRWRMTVDGIDLVRRNNDEAVDTLAQVKCKGIPLDEVLCEVEHEGGPYDAKICFDYAVTCQAGNTIVVKGCEDLDSGESKTKKFTRGNFEGADACTPKASEVKNVDIDVKH